MTDTTKTVRTRYGTFAIDSVRDKKMTEALESSIYPNEGLLEIARKFAGKESIVVDIGAHVGTFAVPIAADVEKVIAFEPSPETFPLLSHNAELNNVSLRLVNKALGSSKGSGTLVVRNASNAGANTLVPGGDISITTLDEEVPHADFIKIDVEGMEFEVLEGGSQLIERARPVVFFEVNLSQLRAHGTSPAALEAFFKERGYALYFPLTKQGVAVAWVRNATLLSALIAPRAWLFFRDSAPFDLLAVPLERALPVPCKSFWRLLGQVVRENMADKGRRLSRIFSSKFQRYTGHTA